MPDELPAWKDKILFTPGPLTTSRTVKQAMLRDWGSRDAAFIAIVRDIRRRLVALAGVVEPDYTAVPMQGSGTFGLEAVVGTAVPRGGGLLVLINGAYGRRIRQMAQVLEIAVASRTVSDSAPLTVEIVDEALSMDPDVTAVAVVHCETTSGLVNPIREIGERVKSAGKAYVVDAMSSFGAIPIDMAACRIDYLVSSANKCIEGVPGFSFVLARTATLLGAAGQARSLSLDLVA